MIDEQKLLHNLKKRNRNSLDDIIKIYTPYVSVIVYNTVGCKLSKEDMEEIVSDTFFLLWQNSLNIDETKGNMRSYLATIARNTSKNKLRKYHSNEVLNEQIISSDFNTSRQYNKSRKQSIFNRTDYITRRAWQWNIFQVLLLQWKNQNNFKSNEYFPVDSQNKTVSR